MMLNDVFGIGIPGGKIFLEIMLDIMCHSKAIDRFQDTLGVVLPIRRVGHRQVVSATHFVQVNKLMGMFDDGETGGRVERGFQADPGKDTGLMKTLERGDAVAGESRAAFPFERERIVQAGECGSESVAVGSEQVEIRDGPASWTA